MAQVPEQILVTIKDYAKKLRQEIPVQKVILFGSYATGTFNEDSDIDIAIISDYFRDMKRVDSINFLLLRAMEYDLDLEPMAFTEIEFKEQHGVVNQIVRTGIEV